MSCPETIADGLVVGAGVGASDVFHWEKILASFIAQSSVALAHPYFYLIQTNTKWSLCLLSGLSPAIYSALLLECELVSVRTSRDGSKTVQLAREKWIDLLNQHGLRGVDAEYTDGQINHSAIFDHRDDAVAEGMFTRRMPLHRVGKVRLGKSPPSNTAINRGDEPPRLSHAMRDVKMRLIESTTSLLVVNEAEREDVSAVEQWVMMTPKNEAEDKISPIKMKCNPDPESPDPAPTPSTPSASSNVGDQSTASAKLEMFTKDRLEKSQCTHKLIEYFRVTGQTDLTILAANSKARTFAKLWIRPTSCSAVMALVVK